VIEKITENPVKFSVISAFGLALFWRGAIIFAGEIFEENVSGILSVSVINIFAAAFAMFLLGVANRKNGFKMVFRAKGFVKGLKALFPVAILFTVFLLFGVIPAEYMRFENLEFLPGIIVVIATTIFTQIILAWGLLVTALLYKESGTSRARVRAVFKGTALFLVLYIIMQGNVGPVQLVNTFIAGAGMCAAYMYSKNLLNLAMVQITYHVLGSVIDLTAVGDTTQIPVVLIAPLVGAWVFVIVFAVKFARRAESFVRNV